MAELHTRSVHSASMEASFLDLRRRTKAILAALDRHEAVTITYRGRPRAVMTPLPAKPGRSIVEHPAFGMWADRRDLADPVKAVREMRRSRKHAV